MNAGREFVCDERGAVGNAQTEAGCELIASLILKNGSKKLSTGKHRSNFLSRVKLRISRLSKKQRQNPKKLAHRNGSNDEILINFKKLSHRSSGKVSSKLSSPPAPSEKCAFGACNENSEKVHGDKSLSNKNADKDAGLEKMRKKKRRRRKCHVEVDEASRLQRRMRYLVIKMKLEQNLIDAYSGEGWKGQSREKIKPLKELQRARRQIWDCKLGIRDAIRQLDSLGSVGSIEDSVIAPDGAVHHEYIFCARCRTNEVFPDNDIILCDGTCNCAFHQKCLDPPLETESIPPGDQGWFCRYCECKMEIIDSINSHLGTQFPLDSHWQDIFKAEAALPNGEVHVLDLEENWPSDDSGDDDYNPQRRITGGCTSLAETDDSMSRSSHSSTSLSCSLDSEILSAVSEREMDGICYADSATVPEEASIISGPRQRAAVDYRKLYGEMFGKDAPVCEAISEDEDWSPTRKRRRQKETDAADTLLTLHESSRTFSNGEISRVDKEIPCESIKRLVSRLPPNAVENLRRVFSENELPSRSVREKLSKDLGIHFEKVNKWFKNARYMALKSRKIHKEPKEPATSKAIPPMASAEDSPLPPGDSDNIVKKRRAKSCARAERKMLERRSPRVQSPQKNEVNVNFDDSICLKEQLKLLKGKNTRKVTTDDGRGERESELEWLCKVKSRIDNLRGKLLAFQSSELKASDESVIYVPIAVVKEKA